MRLTVTISDDQYDYLKRLSKDPAQYISERLDQLMTLDHKNKFLVLRQEHVRQLQELAGGTVFSSPEKLVDYIRGTQAIRFEDGCEVILDVDDLYVLQQQAQGMGAATFEDYLRDFIKESITYNLYGANAGRR